MNFEKISAANLERALLWHPGGLAEWSVADWACATAGEAGEICDAVKKLNRLRDGIQHANGGKTKEEAMKDIATEIGDTYLYLDLLAQRVGTPMRRCFDLCWDMEELATFEDYVAPSEAACLLIQKVGSLSSSAAGYATSGGAFIRREIGMAYLWLKALADLLRLDLERCVVDTFNRVSIREGFPQRLALDELRAAA